ncbi:hypothetical protein [Mycolicibacterium fortuitum]|nr:hypothetical protein [Mycolicibacterium fortuitum]AJR30348.1 hypothetical protein G155_00277 [Mycobacterium sp. VKM Ac-1817D]WEV32816.1 hypothetical protein OMF10_30325 [Mycolicibacterium fortuitum]
MSIEMRATGMLSLDACGAVYGMATRVARLLLIISALATSSRWPYWA